MKLKSTQNDKRNDIKQEKKIKYQKISQKPIN
jgi:hypothetical protein